MENLFDLYFCIAEKFSAGGKLRKWKENLLRVLCILVFAAMLILLPAGICLTADGGDAIVPGITMLAVGASVLIVHIALVLCLAKKRETEEKRDIEEDAAETFADGARNRSSARLKKPNRTRKTSNIFVSKILAKAKNEEYGTEDNNHPRA